jgi:imidazolonepropionase-like amidohydrolase
MAHSIFRIPIRGPEGRFPFARVAARRRSGRVVSGFPKGFISCGAQRLRIVSLTVFAVVAATATSLWSQAAAVPAATPVTAIVVGRLFNPKFDRLLTDQVVLIKGDRIVDVGPAASVKIPADAKRIDLSGATVLPGLIDTHLHVFSSPSNYVSHIPSALSRESRQYRQMVAMVNAQSDLNGGFTTICDLAAHGGGYGTVDLRNAINQGLVGGPRMLVSGPGIQATAGYGFDAGGHGVQNLQQPDNAPYPPSLALPEDMQVADSPWEGRKAVREQYMYGVDWIKIYSTWQFYFKPDGSMVNIPTFTLEETKAIVDEAHRRGLKVACHAYGGEGLHNCLEAGVDAPQHGVDLDEESIKFLLAHNIPLVPTLGDLLVVEKSDSEYSGGVNSRWRQQEKSFKKALAAGIKIGFGSGAGPFPHGTQADQLVYFVRWGMTATQALRTATSTAAEILGWQDRIGSVDAGKFADLIAVSGNPLTDITEMQRVKFVMKGGIVVRDDFKVLPHSAE